MQNIKIRQYKNVWVVFNYGSFRDFFFKKKDALFYIKQNKAEKYYQLYKGEVRFNIEKRVKIT